MSAPALPLAEKSAVPLWLQDGNKRILVQLAAFAGAFAALVSRRPEVIYNPQFWAEDGKYWYADAYHLGWKCLLIPLDGYLNDFSRLVGLFTLLFPFAMVPLVMNLIALTVEVLPVTVFLSSRFDRIAMKTRLAACVLYVALPNSYETHGILTNLQWRLALLSCLILLGERPATVGWKLFDALVLISLSFAGPFGILVIPIALLMRWLGTRDGSNLHLIALLPGALVQTGLILFSHSRPAPPNGATLARFVGIVGGQIFCAITLGMKTILLWHVVGNRGLLFRVEVVAMIVGLGVIAYAVRYGPLELRLFVMFAATVLTLALWSPLVDPSSQQPQWEILQLPGIGNRYYFFPGLAFLVCLFWIIGAPSPWRKGMRGLAYAILALLLIGIYSDWNYPRFKDFHFQQYAAQFERMGPGETIRIPLNPTGWSMELKKK